MDITRFIHYLKSNNFLEIIILIVEFIAIVIGLKFWRQFTIGRLFIFYLAFDFSILGIGFLLKSMDVAPHYLKDFTSITNTLITFVELAIYYNYFQKISNKSSKNYFTYGLIFFGVVMGIYIFTRFEFLTNRLRYISDIISVTEFLLLLPPCFFFYFQILKNDSYFNIVDRPSFWIVTGIFIFCSLSIPFYLISNYVSSTTSGINRQIIGNLFYYLPILINLSFLIKAMLCEKDPLI
jgi:hypothetical protein